MPTFSVLLLLLPTAAVTLADLAFCLGLPLMRWMPLAAFAAVTAWGIYRTPRASAGAWGVFLFCGVLSLWGNGVAMYDYRVYHHPATLLMAEGWNPVWEGTSERLAAAMKVSLEEFNHLHAIHFCKGGQLFGAMVLQWTGLFSGGVWLAWVACACFLAEALRLPSPEGAGERWPRRLCGTLFAVVLFLLTFASAAYAPADLAQSFFLLLFLLAGGRFVRTRACDAMLLAVMAGAWVCALKFSGVLWMGAIFAVFGVWSLLCRRDWRTPLAAGVGIGALTLAMAAAPYLSNTCFKGDPFWPQHGLSARHPAIDLTADFDVRNADAARMGWGGRMAYAYLSPKLVAAWHGRREEVPFVPALRGDADDHALAGFGLSHRVLFLPALLCVLLIPGLRRSVGPCVGLAALCLLLTPAKYVGYSRYVWFALCLPPLVFWAGTCAVRRPWGRVAFAVALCATFALVRFDFVRAGWFAPARVLGPLLGETPPAVVRDLSAKPWAFTYRTPRRGDAGLYGDGWLALHRTLLPAELPCVSGPGGTFPGPDAVIRYCVPPPEPTFWQALSVPFRYALRMAGHPPPGPDAML